jgi:hypothetical protein
MKVERATFEKVKDAQLELIFDHIEQLIEEKETIAPKSRRVFFGLLATSLLGEGSNLKFTLEYKGNIYNLGPLPIFMRKMAYFEDTEDKKQEILLKGKATRVPIDILWKALRENLYIPMDQALRVALKSSAELLTHERSGLEFTPQGGDEE